MNLNKHLVPLVFLSVLVAQAQSIELTRVVSKPVSRNIELPGEFQPYLIVTLHSKVTGFVDKVHVDRGSAADEGELLVEIVAPEMKAQIAEAESKVQVAEAERNQAEAQVAAAQSTLDRLREAAKTPGAVAGNEVVLAEKQVEADKALIESRRKSSQAAQAAVDALKTMESYLKITAPFDGVVTDRLVHPGALVGANAESPLLIIQQISKLRLTVAVPEENVGGIVSGSNVSFKVPAYPEHVFSGTVARIARALDAKTRTMPVELDVVNKDRALAPGMYATVTWPVRSSQAALYVPQTSVVTTTERTFVVRDKGGKAEWVDVRKGPADGDLIQVMGPLQAGDRIVKRATDEMREGTVLQK
jgi:membrane fusion protein, multidrug efflux system